MRRLAAAALLALSGLPVQAGDELCSRTVSVTGRAQSQRPPDFAEITVGVESKAQNPGAALDAASKAVAGILALGRELGVPEGDIGTAAVTLEPVTRMVRRPDGTTGPEPDGYQAANAVTVRLADMGRLGDLLRRALAAGANRIDAIGFGLNEPDRLEAALQVAAARDARARAVEIVEAAGAKLGPLCSLQAVQPGPMLHRSAPLAAKAPRRVPVAAGTIGNAAEVSASFAILP